MKYLKIVIVDDEKRIRRSLINVLKLHYPNARVVAEAENAEKARAVIQAHNPDIVLLDIRMPGATGFDLLNQLKPFTFKIIFITAFNEYAIQAFKFSAVDYLLKPVVPKELVESLNRVSQQINNENTQVKLNVLIDNLAALKPGTRKLALNTNDKMYVVCSSEVIRCDADGNYTLFTLVNKSTILVSRPIKEYEDLLSPFGFFRSHNSHLVNIAHIDRLEKKEGMLVMKDGSQSPVASRKLSELMEALNSQ